MLRIRIKETSKIQYDKGPIEFAQTLRYKSSIKSFKLSEGQIKYFDDKLDSKVIPKKLIPKFRDIPFKCIKTDNGQSLILQDPSNSLCLLKYENNWISSVPFDLLTEDDDIVIFDDNEMEWGISGIKEIRTWNTSAENDMVEDRLCLEKTLEYLSNSLSPFMIKVEHGIIINNIFVI